MAFRYQAQYFFSRQLAAKNNARGVRTGSNTSRVKEHLRREKTKSKTKTDSARSSYSYTCVPYRCISSTFGEKKKAYLRRHAGLPAISPSGSSTKVDVITKETRFCGTAAKTAATKNVNVDKGKTNGINKSSEAKILFLRGGECTTLIRPKTRFGIKSILLLRGTIVSRTYGTHQNLPISLFLQTKFGPIYYGPPK